MPASIPAALIASLPGPSLSSEAISALASQLSTVSPHSPAAVVIDCHSVRDVSAEGLAALLDLRAAHESLRWALVSLSRPVLAAALQIGLAERFTICSDVAAARSAFDDENSSCAR